MRTLARIKNGESTLIEGDAKGRYRLASLTKQFTAAAVGLLVQEGKLGLEDDLSSLLKEFSPGIKLQHLLNHSSGLPDYEDRVTERVEDSTVRRLMAARQMTVFAPGSGYAYSNGGYCLLAQIVSEITPFSLFLQERIFAPLGIHGASFQPEEVKDRVFGFATVGGRAVERDQSLTTGTWGDGGLYMNMEEYLRWLFSLAKEGPWRVENLEAGKKQYISPDLSYAWGWFMGQNGQLLHTGSTCGFSTAVRYDTVSGDGMVYFSNLADDHSPAFEQEEEWFEGPGLLPTVLSLTN